MILTGENLTKVYGEKVLFENINFSIDTGDKVGIVGVNGTGKSTFMAALAGKIPLDEGNIITNKNMVMEYLSQSKTFDLDNTVLQEVFKGDSITMKTLYEYELLLNSERNSEEDIRLGQLSSQIDELNAWDLEAKAKMILNKLGIYDLKKKVKELSGGQVKRLALATTLIKPCDFLLLDEPTNHLDVQSIIWLEEYIKSLKCAVLLVTHDRYFLDNVSNKILELDKGNGYVYIGNYTKYLEQKVARMERENASENKRQNFLRNELKWVQRGALARSTKQKARLQRYEEVKNQKVITHDEKIEMGFAGSRLGKSVIDMENMSYAINGRTIINDFSYVFTKHDRIAILGKNGCGKTTFLNLIAKLLEPTQGAIKIGQTVKIGYFKQNSDFEDENIKAIEYIKDIANYLKLADGTLVSASQLMERFLFTKDLQWAYINKLSGGEKRRLYLMGILMSAPNVLLLDEPTNDLDLETMSVLETFMDGFNGAIIFVSHDRFFVDRIANKVFVYEDKGKIGQYIGGYGVYEEILAREVEQKDKVSTPVPKDTAIKDMDKPKKMTFKEQREYEEIENHIREKEIYLKFIEQQMLQYNDNYGKLNELSKEEAKAKIELDELLDRWAYLEEIAEGE